MKLVPVLVKKSRLHSRHKYQGGVLNPDAVNGKGYYVRRLVGQSQSQMDEKIGAIVQALK
jgi:hypothetical protein